MAFSDWMVCVFVVLVVLMLICERVMRRAMREHTEAMEAHQRYLEVFSNTWWKVQKKVAELTTDEGGE
jgi:hypothetical protein